MKVKTLRQRHPDHDAERLARHRALYEGGRSWRALLETWLPQHDTETDARWKARKAHATYTNHVGAIVDFFASHLFSEALALGDLEDAWLQAWTADVDQAGTSLTDWWADLFLDAMVGRRAYAWVNLPAAGAQAFDNLGDQLKSGALDAYLVPLEEERVIWAERKGGQLQWLLIEDLVEERAGVEADAAKVWRWTYVDAVVIRRWEWAPQPGKDSPSDEDDVAELDPISHNVGRLPVIELDLTAGLWALSKLAEPALAHLRARNDLSWALHMGANPLLVIKSKGGTDSPVLGSGYFLQVGENDDAKYVEPSGSNYQILAEDVVRLREELYRTVQQLAQAADSDATRTRMSGESKQADWQAEEIILAAYAARVKAAVKEAVELVAQIRQLDIDVQVNGLEGWHTEDLAGELEAMAMAVDAMALSPRFRKEAAKLQAERVLGDRVPAEILEQIRKEIDAAVVDDPAPYVPPGPSDDDDEDPDADGDAGEV